VDIPTLAGASDGGGRRKPAPARVKSLQASADEAQRLADEALKTFAGEAEGAAAEALVRAETPVDDVLGGWVEAYGKSADKAAKGIEAGINHLFSEAMEAQDRANQAIAAVGGRPIIMTDEAYAINQAGAHFVEAMNRIVYPAIDQQTAELAGTSSTPVTDTATSPPPPVFSPPPPPAYNPPIGFGGLPGGWEPFAVSPPPPVFVGIPPVPPPGVPPIQPINPNPVPDPPPLPPTLPPSGGTVTVPPVVGPGGECCPPQTIIVNVGGTGGTTPPPVPPGEEPDPSPPPPKPTDPPLGDVVKVGAFDGPDVCQKLAIARDGTSGGFGGDPDHLNTGVGGVFSILPKVLGAIPILGQVLGPLSNVVYGWVDGIMDAIQSFSDQIGIPDPATMTGTIAQSAALGVVERWSGIPLSYLMTPVEQVQKYSNPMYLPAQASVDSLYLSGLATREQWECLTRTHGNVPYWHYRAMEAQRTRPGVGEVVELFMRGRLSLEEYDDRLRQLGVLTRSEGREYIALRQYVPTTQELFTWLKKDVYNEQYATFAGLDEDFPNPMPEAWVEWFRANGTSAEQIKYDYRSQWQLPSRTQVNEFLHRLRPGRVDPAIAFTEDDARQLYKLDEIPAGIRNRLIATSYLPVNRTDIMAAYVAGTMDEQEVYERFLDLGYNQTDARALQSFVVVKSEQQTQASMGVWTRRVIARSYKNGEIDRDTAVKLLGRTVKDLNRVIEALDDVDELRAAEGRGKCIKAIKRKYLIGEYDENDARRALLNLKINVGTVQEMLTTWSCERQSRRKEPTLKLLTDYFYWNLIDAVELERRIRNLGYSDVDAIMTRIVSVSETLKKKVLEQQRQDDRNARLADRAEKKKKKQGGGNPPKG
jgi:hypothetical protein